MGEPTESFWDFAGLALLLFAICIGIGGCMFLGNLHQ